MDQGCHLPLEPQGTESLFQHGQVNFLLLDFRVSWWVLQLASHQIPESINLWEFELFTIYVFVWSDHNLKFYWYNNKILDFFEFGLWSCAINSTELKRQILCWQQFSLCHQQKSSLIYLFWFSVDFSGACRKDVWANLNVYLKRKPLLWNARPLQNSMNLCTKIPNLCTDDWDHTETRQRLKHVRIVEKDPCVCVFALNTMTKISVIDYWSFRTHVHAINIKRIQVYDFGNFCSLDRTRWLVPFRTVSYPLIDCILIFTKK